MRRLIAALLLTAVAACSSSSSSGVTATSQNSQTVKQQELGRAFSMKVGESIQLNDLRLTFRSVEGDSRCPMDAICVWAGDAEIALRIEQGGKAAVAALHTTLEPKKTEWNGYTIQLVSVSPARRASVPVKTEEYRAELLVTR
jgi:hypothetical protein